MLPQATLNNVTIQPPYEEQGLRFETTGYKVSIHIPELRSYVSLSPFGTVVVSLAMEHFLNNTQGQCGESCIMRAWSDDSVMPFCMWACLRALQMSFYANQTA